MAGDGLYLVTQEGVKEIPGMPPGNGRSVFPHGASFLGLFSGGSARVYWPSDTALRFARQNAIKMRADASVMECVELRQRAVALLDWRIECDSEDPEYDQAKTVLEKILRRIPRFLQYRENLLHAIWFGRYAVGNRYTWEWIDGEKCVVVKSWQPIHGDKLVWKIDSDTTDIFDGLGVRVGGVSGLSEDVRQWHEDHRRWIESTEFGWAYFPPPGKRDVLVVHRHYIEDGEYEEPRNASRIFGVGIRDRIYWTWYQKQDALAWLMEFLERSAFGIELWYYPAGNPQAREELRQAAAERAGPNKNILLVPRPPGMEGAVYGVERIEPSLAGSQALKEIITDYFGHQIKRYILGQTLTTEAHATGLGSNLASIHLDTFLQIVRYDAINLQETLTDQLVRRLVTWNWPHLDPSAFRFVIELERDDTREKLEAFQAAFNMGLKIRTADLRDLLDLADPAPDEEFLQNPAYRTQDAGAGQIPAVASNQPPTSYPLSSEKYFLSHEKYSLPPGLPENPQHGTQVTIGEKTYAYLPDSSGRLQWQVVREEQQDAEIHGTPRQEPRAMPQKKFKPKVYTAYHGTQSPQPFTKFDPQARRNALTEVKHGIFLTLDENVARFYAGEVPREEPSDNTREHGRVLQVKVKVSNPLVLDGRDYQYFSEVAKIANEVWEIIAGNTSVDDLRKFGGQYVDDDTASWLADWIDEHGVPDAIRITDTIWHSSHLDPADELIVFDPDQVDIVNEEYIFRDDQ